MALRAPHTALRLLRRPTFISHEAYLLPLQTRQFRGRPERMAHGLTLFPTVLQGNDSRDSSALAPSLTNHRRRCGSENRFSDQHPFPEEDSGARRVVGRPIRARPHHGTLSWSGRAQGHLRRRHLSGPPSVGETGAG